MTRVHINILGISELKRMEMGEFNSEDHYIYYCGQESHRRNGVALIVNKTVQNATGEEWRAITNSPRKNKVAGPKQKGHSVVDVVKVKSNAIRNTVA